MICILTHLLQKVYISTQNFITINYGKWIYSTDRKNFFLCSKKQIHLQWLLNIAPTIANLGLILFFNEWLTSLQEWRWNLISQWKGWGQNYFFQKALMLFYIFKISFLLFLKEYLSAFFSRIMLLCMNIFQPSLVVHNIFAERFFSLPQLHTVSFQEVFSDFLSCTLCLFRKIFQPFFSCTYHLCIKIFQPSLVTHIAYVQEDFSAFLSCILHLGIKIFQPSSVAHCICARFFSLPPLHTASLHKDFSFQKIFLLSLSYIMKLKLA